MSGKSGINHHRSTEFKVSIVNAFTATCRPATLGLILCFFGSSAYAQADGGIKLGDEAAKPADTLDLGATPATPGGAKKPAQQPLSTEPVKPGALKTDAEAKRTTHGAWEVACAADGKTCAMAQIGNDSSGTPVLEMVIRKLPEPLEVGDQTAIAVLDVITPLGVVLTDGLSIKIDKGKAESAPFQICTEQGCLVREPIDADLIRRMKRGRIAKITVIAANQGEVTANISLKGFTKAYAAVK
ncbi:MAG: invasion associated locus B family protein [Granulosicoccus sp.]